MSFILQESIVHVKKLDEVYVLVSGKHKTLQIIQDHFSYYVDNYTHMPSFRMGRWDGKTRFLRFVNEYQNDGIFPIGLLAEFELFCNSSNIKIVFDNTVFEEDTDLGDFDAFLTSLNLPYVPRDYQLEYVKQAIKKKKLVIVSPTGSGKSLILYIYIMWLMQHFSKTNKLLLIVPTIDLVHQMDRDFKSYGHSGEDISLIHGGQEKKFDRLTISTWQSIYKLDPKTFEQFRCIMIDEVHKAQAANITSICHHSSKAEFRLGTTGTVYDELNKRQQIVANIGPIFQVVSTTQLQAEDFLAKHVIKTILLKWKLPKGVKFNIDSYASEYDLITLCDERKRLVLELAQMLDGRTKGTVLILARRVEYLKELSEMAKQMKFKNKIYLVTGRDTKALDRKNALVETKLEGGIIFATSDLLSTGVNIPNIDAIVMATPMKSKITLLQSFGRGMRQTAGKTHLEVYDIIDSLPMADSAKKNYTSKHRNAKRETYQNEDFINQEYHLKLLIKIGC